MARISEQDYPAESEGQLTGKALQGITQSEVRRFNLDFDRLIDDELSLRAQRILENAREYAFEVTRHVMQRANQRYGGTLALGNEVGLRLLRPLDLVRQTAGTPVGDQTAHSWQFSWGAVGVRDAFGEAADDTQQVNLDDQSNAEAHLIVGWTNNHAAPKTEAIQSQRFNRTNVAQPLPWDAVVDGRGGIKVIEANPWFAAFPGETYQYSVRTFAAGADVLRALGVYMSIGTNLRTL
jgi:hypothetical protein